MAPLRNLRHEMFCREYAKTGQGAEAYRRAYPTCDPVETARCNGWRLLNRQPVARKINRRIQELRTEMMKRSDITMERILTDYEEAKEMARSQAKPNELISAATAQAKLVGLLRDRQEVGAPGDYDGIDDVQEILAKVAEEAGPEVAEALSKIFGASSPVPQPQEPTVEEFIESQPPSDSVN